MKRNKLKFTMIFQYCLTSIFIFYSSFATALTFKLPENGDNLIGKIYHITVHSGDTFAKIGRRYDVGYYSLVEANPSINPSDLKEGTQIIIPARFIIPNVEKKGIVINLAELRLYYFPPNGREIITFPVGIGREGWDTPIGLTYVGSKTKNPTWFVPDSIRNFRASEGVILPKNVPPGPDNPLGGYALRLASTTYLIHGTNDYTGVGRRSSSGCIRMLPEDVEQLFDEITPKTPVNIINVPYKLGWHNDKLFLEAHLPLEGNQAKLYSVTHLIEQMHTYRPVKIDWDITTYAVKQQTGIPEVIGYAQGPWLKPLIAQSSTQVRLFQKQNNKNLTVKSVKKNV
ncbi:MAG: hypothetical protein LEGION0398_MBIBDBAK_00319 [Legionellaceae bacterium]